MIELEQKQLGYVRWESFQTAIQRHPISDHFRGVTKLIIHGKGSLRDVNDEATQ